MDVIYVDSEFVLSLALFFGGGGLHLVQDFLTIMFCNVTEYPVILGVCYLLFKLDYMSYYSSENTLILEETVNFYELLRLLLTSEGIPCVIFCYWVASLRMTLSSSIQFPKNFINSLFLIAE